MKRILIRVGVIVVAALIGLWLGNSWVRLSERAQHPEKRSSATETRQRLTVVAPDRMGRMGNLRPTWCPHEDGDPMLYGCIWQNPRTGKTYYVDSVEYRD